jgi:hypothetical protein
MKPVHAFIALWACLAGCVTQPAPPDANVLQPVFPALPQARFAPLPASVGVYYTPKFSIHPVADRSAPGLSHRPGAASIALVDRVLESAFERVVRLSAWPLAAAAEPPEYSLVFVPRIAGIATIRNPPGQAAPASAGRLLEYRVEVFTPAGERIDSWTLHAKSRMDGAWTAREDRLYPAALRDASAQLLTSIAWRPALTSRLPGARPAEGSVPAPHPVSRATVRLAIASLLEPAESRERRTASDAACLAEALTRTVPQASVVPLEDVQDALYPWFEHSSLMDTAQRMPELLRQPTVREGIRSAGLDYVALIHTERSSERNSDAVRCDTTYKAPGCSGVRGDALKTRLQVTLWNLRRFTMSARFEVEGAGAATFAGLTVPIPGSQASSVSACERAAEAIGNLVGLR